MNWMIAGSVAEVLAKPISVNYSRPPSGDALPQTSDFWYVFRRENAAAARWIGLRSADTSDGESSR